MRTRSAVIVLLAASVLSGTGSRFNGTTTAASPAEGPPYEVKRTADVLYQEAEPPSHELLLDVYAPVADGPWPVVITYHPFSVYNDKSSMMLLAQKLAERGAVVFNVTYGSTTMEDLDEVWAAAGNCTYWYAAEHAATYGGDPSDITMVGFSGGANTAADIAMDRSNRTAGCLAGESAVEPAALVLHEGDWLIAPFWDSYLAADPTMFDRWTVWSQIEDYAGFPIHLVVDSATTKVPSYWYGTQDGIHGALRMRDPDGDLAEPIKALGLTDDGVLDLTDASLLFRDRLLAAGHPTSVTWTESMAHTMTDEVMDAITALVLSSPEAPE
jgi:acetyl esterase/lipase